MSFITFRILYNLSLKCRKWHFRVSRFQYFPGKHPLEIFRLDYPTHFSHAVTVIENRFVNCFRK